MQAQTINILERCLEPQKARVIAEAMENEISGSRFVTQNMFNHAMDKVAWEFERVRHELRAEMAQLKSDLMKWTISMMVGQTALTVGLTTGIMYFLLKH